QPRHDDRRRDPRPAAPLGRRVRTDDRDRHARGACRVVRRPGAVPRRRPDRARPRPDERQRSAPRDGRAQRRLTKFALKGLLGRKLRTALTCIAIVLGVAMVTGTYILTDSIKGAFGGIFTEIYSGTDATVTGKSAFNLTDQNNTTAPPFDESLLDKVRALPDVADAGGRGGGEADPIWSKRQVNGLRR